MSHDLLRRLSPAARLAGDKLLNVINYAIWAAKLLFKYPLILIFIKLGHHNFRPKIPKFVCDDWPAGSPFRRRLPFLGLTIGEVRPRNPFQVIYVVNDSGGIPSPKFIPIASSRRFRDLSKVNLDEIGIDEPDYILRVKEIHAGTDDLAPMACFVQPRPDGKLWVMDGNHRVLTWAKEPELEIRFLVTL